MGALSSSYLVKRKGLGVAEYNNSLPLSEEIKIRGINRNLMNLSKSSLSSLVYYKLGPQFFLD